MPQVSAHLVHDTTKHGKRTDTPLNRFRDDTRPESTNTWSDPVHELPANDVPLEALVDHSAEDDARLKEMGKDPRQMMAKQRDNEKALASNRKALNKAVPEGDITNMAADDHTNHFDDHDDSGKPRSYGRGSESKDPSQSGKTGCVMC